MRALIFAALALAACAHAPTPCRLSVQTVLPGEPRGTAVLFAEQQKQTFNVRAGQYLEVRPDCSVGVGQNARLPPVSMDAAAGGR